MTVELILGGGLVLITAGLVVWGLWSLKDHGRDEERVKSAEEQRDALREEAEASSLPPASRSEASAILRDRLARAARRLRAREGGRSE